MMSFLRAFFQSWQSLTRQTWIWLATLAVCVLAYASVHALFSVHVLAEQALAVARSRVDVSVTFKPSTPVSVVEQARTYFGQLPQTASVSVVTADQSLERFRARFRGSKDVERALTEVGRNPFGARLVLQAKTLEGYGALISALNTPAYAEWIQYQSIADHGAAIQELERMRRAVELIGSLLLAVFVCVGMLLVFNAVRMAIFTQRDEILIMRLVGASKWRIRLPFMLAVFWVSVLAWASVIALGTGLYAWLLPQTGGWMREGLEVIRARYILVGMKLLLVQLGIAGGLSMFVAYIATGKYIKR